MEVMAYRDCRVAVEVLLSAVSSAKGKLQTFLVKRISSAGTGYSFSTKRTKNRRNWFDCLMNPLWKQKSPLWNRKNTVPLNNRHKWTWFYKWEGWYCGRLILWWCGYCAACNKRGSDTNHCLLWFESLCEGKQCSERQSS